MREDSFSRAYAKALAEDDFLTVMPADLTGIPSSLLQEGSFIAVEPLNDYEAPSRPQDLSQICLLRDAEQGLRATLERRYEYGAWDEMVTVEDFFCALHSVLLQREKDQQDVVIYRASFYDTEAEMSYDALLPSAPTLDGVFRSALEFDAQIVREAATLLRSGFRSTPERLERIRAPADSFYVGMLLVPDEVKEANLLTLARLPLKPGTRIAGTYLHGVVRVAVIPSVKEGLVHLDIFSLPESADRRTLQAVPREMVPDLLQAMGYEPGVFEWGCEPFDGGPIPVLRER